MAVQTLRPPPTKAKPAPWPIQPLQVAPEWRWAWEKARFLVPTWEGAGGPVDIIEGLQPSVVSLGETAWGVDNLGRGIAGPGSTTNAEGIDYPHPIESGWSELTMILACRRTSDFPNNLNMLGLGNATPLYVIQEYFASTVRVRFYVSGAEFKATDVTVDADKDVLIVGRWRSGGAVEGLTIEVGTGETLDSSTSGTATGTTDSPGNDVIAYGGWSERTRTFPGIVYMGGIWEHRWSDSQLRQLARDPFGPFRRQQLRLIEEEAAPGAGETITRSLLDDLILTEASTRDGDFTRSVADSLTLTETLERTRELARKLLDNLNFSETLSRAKSIFTRNPFESLSFSETLEASGEGINFEEAAEEVRKLVRAAKEYAQAAVQWVKQYGESAPTDEDRLTRDDEAAKRYDD